MRHRCFAALALLLLLMLQASPASAHARYEGSTPSDGESLSSPPSRVEADFSEPVTSDSYLEVTDPCGAVVSGDSSPVADKVSVSVSASRAGTYSVFFRVQSSVDAHVTEGSFSFTSSGGEPCPGEEPPPGGSGGGNDPPNPGGGGGNDDAAQDNDPSTTGGGDSPTSDGNAAAVDDGAVDEAPGANSSGGGDSVRNGAKGQGHGKHEAGRKGGGSRNLSVSRAAGERRRGPDPWDLPRDGLIVGLSIAAVIGAVGGRIYAGIIGPRS